MTFKYLHGLTYSPRKDMRTTYHYAKRLETCIANQNGRWKLSASFKIPEILTLVATVKKAKIKKTIAQSTISNFLINMALSFWCILMNTKPQIYHMLLVS